MPETLTFIHAADLHIGAPFRGLRALSDEWARRLVDAIPGAWDRVVEAAVSRKVDFMVVSGDIFDSVRASYRDYLRFFDGLNRLDAEGIPSYLCTGNHDPLSLWQQDFFALPPSATMLAADRPDFALYERDRHPLAVIGGRGYPNKVWSPNENIAEGITRAAAIRALGPRAAEAPFAVGVLHTGLTFDPVKAPTDPVALLRAGFDYWALGHIHKRWVNDERAPRIAFSGCIQGRDVRETGPRGVNLVTLAVDAPPKVSFIPTASGVGKGSHRRLRLHEHSGSGVQNHAGAVRGQRRRLLRDDGVAHHSHRSDLPSRGARPPRGVGRGARLFERCVLGILLR